MTGIQGAVFRFEARLDAPVERFLFRHRVLGALAVFLGVPLLALGAVCLCAMGLALPFATAFGWM